jgi:hypothetical protein
MMETEFETKLIDLGFTYHSHLDGYFIICQKNKVSCSVKVQLVCSETVNEEEYGSHNGNEIHGIGVFRFRLPPTGKEPDFLILAFQNKITQYEEYVIIPTDELKRRLIKINHKFEVVFWLMGNSVYNATSIGLEGEWYFLSQGVNGRLADGSDLDFTKFLNNWGPLAVL